MTLGSRENHLERHSDLPKLLFRARRLSLIALALGIAALSWGCAGFVAGQTSQTNSTPQTGSISGTISPAAGGSGATVTLSGAATGKVTADGSGNYVFTGLTDGTYAVTPSHTGYAFTPTSQTATINGANVTGINFTATATQTHSVALSWIASTSAVNGYNVYRSTVSGTGYAKINSALITLLSYTDTTVQNGVTYYYVTTAVDSTGTESAFSNQAQATVP